MPLDLSSLLVLVEPEGRFAQDVFNFPENAKCRHYGLAIDALADEGHEAEIDHTSQIIYSGGYVPVHLALNFNQSPKDVSKGFVFGSDPETCDVLLSTSKYTGVSGNHFSINVDWATGNPLITCLTSDDGSAGIRIKSSSLWELYLRNAWKVLDPGSTTTIKMFESMQLLVYSPGRESRGPAYNDNVRSYFKRCQNAVPELTHLKLYDPEPTPLLVSRGRGLTGMEYFATSTVVREKVVLCEAKSHQNLLGDVETFIVKRFRNVSDQWPKHAKTSLYKLCNLRHRYIIAPEDIITVTMEYMPVYLPEPPETLADRQTKDPLTLVEANQVLAQVFEGLKFLHANGIVHGGLYPGSIRINRSTPLSIKLSDIGLDSYVDLENAKEREYYACHPAPSISEPMPKHDTWSAGVVGLNLILPGGLPPRRNLFHYDQSAWTASMAAQAKSFHASQKPGFKKDAALFLTRVLQHDYRERLSAEECLQDPWIRLGKMSISDSQDPSDPFFYRSGGDAPLEILGGVEDHEGSGEVREIAEPRTVRSKGKQPQGLRQTGDTPSSILQQQRAGTSQSLGYAGVIPTHSRRTSVTPSSSSHQQRRQQIATPRSLVDSSVTPAKPRYRDIKPSESISRQSSDPIPGITVRGEYTLKKRARYAHPRKFKKSTTQQGAK